MFARLVPLALIVAGCSSGAQDGEPRDAPKVVRGPDHNPQVCLGYDPETRNWGPAHRPGMELCPIGFAYLSTKRPAQGLFDPFELVGDSCCPLPASDIVLDVQVTATRHCPANAVAVGSVTATSRAPWNGPVLICRFINTARYKFGPDEPGVYWGVGGQVLVRILSMPDPLIWRELPLGVRYAVGRRGLTEWEHQGCLSARVGALLVGVGVSRCENFSFRRLLFRGIPGDPPENTEVEIFRSPATVTDIFDDTITTSPR